MASGKAPDPPQMKAAPEPVKFGSFKDLVNNVQAEGGTDARGRETFLMKEIEKDPKFEAMIKEFKGSFDEAIRSIDELANINMRLVAPFHGYINTISQLNEEDLRDWSDTVRPEDFTVFKQRYSDLATTLNNEDWDNYDLRLEENLTARRIHNSSLAIEARDKNQRSRSLTNSAIQNDAELVGEQLATADMNRKIQQYQGRNHVRSQQANIAQQQLGLEQSAVDKELMNRDDKIQKLAGILGMKQNIVNADINTRRGQNVAPIFFDAQTRMTDQRNAVWAQNNNQLNQQYAIRAQNAQADAGMLGNIAQGAIIGGSYLLGGPAGGAAAAAAAKVAR